MAESFSTLGEETDVQIQEAQKVQNKINPKRPTLRHIMIKLSKFKDEERVLKAARERQLVMHKGTISRFFHRNYVGQKCVTQYIQRAERKTKQTNKNPNNQEYSTWLS